MNNKNIFFLKKELEKIKILFAEKKFESVINKTKNLLKKNPKQAILYNFLGLSYFELEKTEISKNVFNTAMENITSDASIFCNAGIVEKKLRNYKEAEKYFSIALKIDPNHLQSHINLGNLKNTLNDDKSALNYYLKAYNINNNVEQVLLYLILSYSANSYFQEAKKIITELQQKFPNNTKSYQLYSKIHNYQDEDENQKIMLEKIKDQNLSHEDLSNLYFAIAKSYFDQKNINKSAEYTLKANKAKLNTFDNYNFNNEENEFKLINKYFENLDFKNNMSTKGENLIFILGLPRSGTTLLHQIIASHSKVFGAEESPFASDFFAEKFNNNKNFETFFTKEIFNENLISNMADNIISKYKMYNQNKIIVDKMPFNFKWIGFIRIFFPRAKIIHSNRNTVDTAFSIYRNLFDSPMPWSYHQEYLIKYINLYKNLMVLWNNKYQDFIYDYQYENLINNQVEETKKILEFCNLDFEESCIDYTKNKLPVKTVSVSQAKQKIYKSSIKLSDKYLSYFPFLRSA